MRKEPDSLQALLADILEAEFRGEPVDRDSFVNRHPQHATPLREFFANHDSIKDGSHKTDATLPPASFSAVGDATLPLSTNWMDGAILQARDEEATLPPGEAPARGTASVGDKVRYFGDYELLEEIARGGMGVVYKARQANLDRIVALKMILAGELAGAEDVQRFKSEAEAAAQLDHPYIVPIYEIGDHQGRHYFSMGFVDGQSLADRLHEGPLPVNEAAELTAKIAESIEYAHESGVIHRDLKPANVLIDKHGNPRVTDFGLAKRIEGDSQLTRTGQILGTPAYMPPEQAAGLQEAVGKLSDVYSLGAILYAMLTGRPPFQAATPMETLLQVLEREPVAPRKLNSALPRDIETICLKCLSKSPDERYASAKELADDCTRFLAAEPIQARRMNLLVRGAKIAWRRNRQLAVVLLLLIASAILYAGMQVYNRWQLGTVYLSSQINASAELKDQKGRSILNLSVPTNGDQAVASGDYTLRLRSNGVPSEEYRLYIPRGTRSHYTLPTGRKLLWPVVADCQYFQAVDCDQKSCLVVRHARDVEMIDGATGERIWNCTDVAGEIADLRFDANDDGYQDYFVVDSSGSKQHARIQVLSGHDGRLLWTKASVRLKDLGIDETQISDGVHGRGARSENIVSTWVIAPPSVTEVGADRPLIVAVLQAQESDDSKRGRVFTWVEALDAGNGETVWKQELSSDLGPIRNAQVRSPRVVENGRSPVCISFNAQVDDRRNLFVCLDDRVHQLDANTGEVLVPATPLPEKPQLMLLIDFPDSGPQLLTAAAESKQGEVGRTTTNLEYGLYSFQQQEYLWKFSSQSYPQLAFPHSFSNLIIEDLNGDQIPELLIPTLQFLEIYDTTDGERIQVLKGRFEYSDGLCSIPDVDGDNWRDICTVSSGGHLSVLSSFSGQLVYEHDRSKTDGASTTRHLLAAPLFDVQGFPYVLQFEGFGRHANLSLRSVRTGAYSKIEPLVDSSFDIRAKYEFIDLNQDGVQELTTITQGNLISVSLVGGVDWQRIGQLEPVLDHDADGFRDLYISPGNQASAKDLTGVVSGKTGEILWTGQIKHSATKMENQRVYSCELPYADLDEDNLPDLLYSYAIREEAGDSGITHIIAVSGCNGKQFWRTAVAGNEKISSRHSDLRVTTCQDVDGDSISDVIVIYKKEIDSLSYQTFHTIRSGSDGELLWKYESAPHNTNNLVLPRIIDLDGDGVNEVLISTKESLRALRFPDASELWSRALVSPYSQRLPEIEDAWPESSHASWFTGDLGYDGAQEVLCYDENPRRIVALDGINGELRWSWELPNPKGSGLPQVTLADLDGDGQKEICVLNKNYNRRAEIFRLDDQGVQLSRIQLPYPRANSDLSFERVLNLDEDPADEILCHYSSGLLALKGKDLDQGWKIELEDRFTALSTTKASGSNEVLVAVQTAREKPIAGERNRVSIEESGFVVLRGSSGQKLWDLLLPDDRSTPVLLNPGDALSNLRLLANHHDAVVCYEAVNRSQ